MGLRTTHCLLAALLVGLASCRTAPPARVPLVWRSDLAVAMDEARRTNKPLLVLAVIGDVDHQC